jgi:DNA-binding SARP family transcriptional activator
MSRERLDVRLDEIWQHGLALVVAPAGSGKTTLLAAWAAAAARRGIPAAWYRAESTDGDPATLLAFLEAAVAEAIPDGHPPIGRGWTSAEAAADGLRRWPGERLLLVIDDLHTLAGTEAEASLGRLLDYAGPSLAVAAGTRTLPDLNLSRRRVSGGLLEIGGDDLRFRPWEVEALFRDFYGESLRGDELARLARRTEGWAAGLQLFHLATRGKPSADRLRVLEGLARGSRLVRGYLAQNVLVELPDELREFLVDTCVLRRLSGPICDRFLGRTGSGALLDELERRQVFTVALDDEGTYRYHEVLRGHLEGVLVEQRGEAEARASSARAAALLEEEGAIAEALAAWCRAEAWDEVARLLGTGGARLAAGGGTWLDAVPPALLAQDPWLMLATARRLRADGQWRPAIEVYGRAEASFAGADAAVACLRERLALAAFMDPIPRPGTDWTSNLRHALAREPIAHRMGSSLPIGVVAADSGGPVLADGLAALLAGRVAEARRTLTGLSADPGAAPQLGAAAGVAAAAAALLAGDPRGRAELEAAIAAAERLGLGWLARVGRAAAALDPSGDAGADGAAALRSGAAARDDGWGELLGALLEAWATLADPDRSIRAADAAASLARRLGAGTLEAWSKALGALAAAALGMPDARESALQAEGLIRATGIPGARIAVHLALATADPRLEAEHRSLAEAAAVETGLRPPPGWPDGRSAEGEAAAAEVDAHRLATSRADGAQTASGPRIAIQLFGGFAMTIDGQPVDLSALKPRPRALLRLLALDAGRPVHREVLTAAFWPEVDPETAARNLHVALSGLRRAVDGAGALLVRDGDAYQLALPQGARVDLVEFEQRLAEGRVARDRGYASTAIERYREALRLAGKELLPEDGPAEWVVDRREAVRGSTAEAARALGELLLPTDPDAAATAFALGLRADPYHDPLWRLLAEAHDRAGDLAAASAARRDYARMLDRLGILADAVAPQPTDHVLPAALRPAPGARPATAALGTRPR